MRRLSPAEFREARLGSHAASEFPQATRCHDEIAEKKLGQTANRTPLMLVPVLEEGSRFTYYVSALLVRFEGMC